MNKLYNRIKEIASEIKSHQITVYAAQASFYLIISVFPFIMLLLSLVGYFVVIPKQTIVELLKGIFPDAVSPVISVITDELFGKSIQVVSVSAIMALWSASRGFAALERGIRHVYNTPRRKIFAADYASSVMYTLIFIVVIVLTLILQVFGNVLIGMVERYIVFNQTEIVFIKGVLFFVLMCLVFQFMYYIFDRRRKKLKKHLPGAVFSTAGWMIFSNLFSIYIDNFADYSYIYGSLAAVVLLMLWLYFCVMILLLGAELNNYMQKKYI